MKTSDAPIIIEHQYNASAQQLWDALTNLPEMRKWYVDNIPAFEPKVGFKTEFVIHNEGRTFTHQWEILSVQPQKEITYSWRFKEYNGVSTSQFLIEDETAESVTLKLVVKVLEDFPEGIPEFKAESCLGGWDYFLNQQLKSFLEN